MFGQKIDVPSMSDGISVLAENVKIYLWPEDMGNTGREELTLWKIWDLEMQKHTSPEEKSSSIKAYTREWLLPMNHIYIAL